MRILSGFAALICALASFAAEAKERPIRYAEWFLKSGCDWSKLETRAANSRSPFPAELLDYTPPPRQLAGFLWDGGGCPIASDPDLEEDPERAPLLAPKLPKAFACRLDRLVYRERKSGRDYPVERAHLGAVFQYVAGAGSRTEHLGDPLPLRDRPYRSYSTVQVELKVSGQRVALSSEDAATTPAHQEFAFISNEDAEYSAAKELPIVTARNARHFVFDIAGQPTDAKEGVPHGVRDGIFVPVRCRTAR